MMNAGLLELIVVDDWKAKMWAQVLPKIKVREDIVLRPTTKTGWAIRKDSPKLAAVLNDFYVNWVKKQGVDPAPPAAVHEDDQGSCTTRRAPRTEALRAD